MSFIETIRIHGGIDNGTCGLFVCLDKNDCKTLLKELETIKKKYEKRYDKYYDIQMSGEATEKQQTLLLESEEDLKCIDSIIDDIEKYLK